MVSASLAGSLSILSVMSVSGAGIPSPSEVGASWSVVSGAVSSSGRPRSEAASTPPLDRLRSALQAHSGASVRSTGGGAVFLPLPVGAGNWPNARLAMTNIWSQVACSASSKPSSTPTRSAPGW